MMLDQVSGRKTAVKAQLREGQAVHRAIDGSSNAYVKYDTVTGLADTFFKQNFFLSILIKSCSAEFDNLAQQGVAIEASKLYLLLTQSFQKVVSSASRVYDHFILRKCGCKEDRLRSEKSSSKKCSIRAQLIIENLNKALAWSSPYCPLKM
ncbi:hypothetical protein VTP01DRAFT_1339 [Rhizomucor pusillus]|uniref:uncharacterized protein n=1 Tax=Rhizomucor pusillus TaxID=4840 RepID=UPI003742D85F